MVVRGDELLFESLFLKANTTLSATLILFLFPFTLFFYPYLMGGSSHYIVSFQTISIVHLLII